MQELQKIDLQRDDAKRKLEAIVEQIADPPFVEGLDTECEAQTLLAAQAAGALREAAAAVETAQRRIDAADKRLYGGAETNPRVLEDLQRDLYAQRQRLTELRDAELAARNHSDENAAAERWLRELRETSLHIWNTGQAELREQRDNAQSQVTALNQLVDEQRKRLSQSDLSVYDAYRLRRPRVVAAVAGGVCEECRLTLPTMIITRARRANDPIECPSCGCLVKVA